jgi:uncharacterized protein YdaU (DUF1376 family)
MNHYPRHVGDFIRDTVGLSLAERGAYTALLDQYYASEKPIAYAERYRLTGAISKADKAAVDYVISRYFTEQADGWHQKRADAEILAYRDRSESARKSVSVRWNKRDTNVLRTNAERNTNQEPVTSNQVKTKPLQAAPAGVRPEVWEAWQRQRGRKLTADAVRLQTAFLAKQPDDPNEVIEQSIRNGWAGLFPLKGAAPAAVQSKRAATAAAMMRTTMKESDEPSDITAESVRVA